MKHWFYKYRWILLAMVILFNTALFVKFLYDQHWIGDSYNEKMKFLITEAFEKQIFKPDVFKQKEDFRQFFAFLSRHSDSLLKFRIQQDFKPVKMDGGGTFLYRKIPGSFQFYNWKDMYQYIPENLQDSLRGQFEASNGWITGFSVESPALGESVDGKRVNIRVLIKEDEEMYANYLSHSIISNRKTRKANPDEYLVKDTLLDSEMKYYITAFLAQIE